MNELLSYIAVAIMGLVVGAGIGFMFGYDLAFKRGEVHAAEQIQPYHLAHAKLYKTMLDLGDDSHIVVYFMKGGVRYATKGIDPNNRQATEQKPMGQSETSS